MLMGCGGGGDDDDTTSGSSPSNESTSDAGDNENTQTSQRAPGEDAIAKAIEQQLAEQGVSEVREEDEGPVLVMGSGSTEEQISAACEKAQEIVGLGPNPPDVRYELDGSVQACPATGG
jgi:hypothetical protein